jgi:hypothetical protein
MLNLGSVETLAGLFDDGNKSAHCSQIQPEKTYVHQVCTGEAKRKLLRVHIQGGWN